MNETKDKVRYLESLKRHLDQLYNGATPANIINSALPGLINTVKQMDSISRFYARQGFLGLLFTKVRRLSLSCRFSVLCVEAEAEWYLSQMSTTWTDASNSQVEWTCHQNEHTGDFILWWKPVDLKVKMYLFPGDKPVSISL